MNKRTKATGEGEEKHAKATGEAGEKFTVPAHLSREMRTWISDLLEEWNFSVAEFKILLLGATSWDLAEKCRVTIARKTPVYTDRFGSPKSRPECAVLRDSRIGFLRCMAALNLAMEEEPEPEEEQTKRRPYRNFREQPEWLENLNKRRQVNAETDPD